MAWAALAPATFALPAHAEWTFVDVTEDAGVDFTHAWTDPGNDDIARQWRGIAGGVAAGDYDRDGWLDLYVVGGDLNPNLLFRNLHDGTFEERGLQAGVATHPVFGAGPVFADIDGDVWLDIVVGGVEGSAPVVYRNRHDGTFENVSAAAGLDHGMPQLSVALADFDADGVLEMAATHWLEKRLTLWDNDGDGHFSDISEDAGVDALEIYSFTPIFSDITGNGRLDLLVASDFGTSELFFNDGSGGFFPSADPDITDENGMGAVVADLDNDLDFDWFVTSIWDPNGIPEANWGVTGNRYYENLGGGNFADATEVAGLRQGYWGWGACAADFNNDGRLDVFHVNGFGLALASEFHDDPARLFVQQPDGTFLEQAAALGVADTGQGRGVVCFDYDRDGDADIFIANNDGPSRLFRNDGGNAGSYLSVRLRGEGANSQAIGARVYATVGASTQVREIRAGSNFESSDPSLAHFGLGSADRVDLLRVVWPNQEEALYHDVATRRSITLQQAGAVVPMLGHWGSAPAFGLFLAGGMLALARLRNRSKP